MKLGKFVKKHVIVIKPIAVPDWPKRKVPVESPKQVPVPAEAVTHG